MTSLNNFPFFNNFKNNENKSDGYLYLLQSSQSYHIGQSSPNFEVLIPMQCPVLSQLRILMFSKLLSGDDDTTLETKRSGAAESIASRAFSVGRFGPK